jgi:hypothetical protein
MKVLWEVHVVNKNNNNPIEGEHLWIVARTIQVATKKAIKFVKRRYSVNVTVTQVIRHGTIDA